MLDADPLTSGESTDFMEDVLLVLEPHGEGMEHVELSRDLVGVGRQDRRMLSEDAGDSILLVLPVLLGVEKLDDKFFLCTFFSSLVGVAGSSASFPDWKAGVNAFNGPDLAVLSLVLLARTLADLCRPPGFIS